MVFKTRLLQAGKTATGIVIPDKIVESFNAGKKPPVKITINKYTYRNTVAVMGGVYMVGVSAEHRKAANIVGGQEISVTIELDTEPREVAIPTDLQKAFGHNPGTKQVFEKLSISRQKALVIPINDAKTAGTRDKRIEKAIDLLKDAAN